MGSLTAHQMRRLFTLMLAGFIAFSLAACPASQTPQQRAEGLYEKGNQLWDQGKPKEAIAAYEQAISIDPNYYDAQFQLGLVYKKIGDAATSNNNEAGASSAYDKSIIYYRKAIAINPNDPSAHNNLANVYFAQKRYDESIEEYQKAIAQKPYDPDYHYNMANAYSKKGMAKQAIEHFEEAIRIDPNYFDAYYNIANLYEKQGDNANAIRYYQEYANRENRPSEAEWVERAKQKIQQLRGAIY